MLRIWFEWLDFAFECLEFGSNDLNFDLDVLNPIPIVRIYIRMFRISF